MKDKLDAAVGHCGQELIVDDVDDGVEANRQNGIKSNLCSLWISQATFTNIS